MSSLLRYSGLTTKLSAMRGQLIKKDEYLHLAEAASVSEFVEQLKKHKNYVDVFEDIEPESIHRGELEKLMMYGAYRDFSKIYMFADMNQRKYLKLYFMRYEVSMLKRAIRGLNYEDSQSYFDRAEVIFSKYSDIDIQAVYAATTIEGIIEALKGTVYYEPLLKVSGYARHTIFDYEMALDIFCFKHIWKKKKQFKGKELKNISEVTGTDIDFLNILWIYRAKKYYKLSGAKIYDIIIPISFRLKKVQIKELVETADENEFLAVVNKTRFGKYFNEAFLEDNSPEKLYKKIIHNLNARAFSLNPYSLAGVNTFLTEKNEEIQKLIKIAESIRYGYKSDTIIAEII